ncbi:superoxide dismutase [Candidatus Parcubacteria bacterium]|nr:MAG: superoxide dismutase [Candidatus Parcubacteria bacterium]
MTEEKYYKLPELPYGYNSLEPYISADLLTIHHQKHHATYVTKANAILEKSDNQRNLGSEMDLKAMLKALSFNIGGHILHSLFWENLCPEKESNAPEEKLASLIASQFVSFERFKEEFVQTAMEVEGSGWAALTFCHQTKRLLIMQIEKHNLNIYPLFSILLVLDAFEHAYYLDYKNEKATFFKNFWKIVNWKTVARRLKSASK